MSLGKIMVVSSKVKEIRLLVRILAAYDYQTLTAGNSAQAINMLVLEQPDLAVLQLDLEEGPEGIELVRQIREFSDIPIIILSDNSNETNLLEGFEAGVDDFIYAPYSSKVLIARLQAVLKRTRRRVPEEVEKEIVCGQIRINLLGRTVTVDGNEVYLTATEFQLLRELALHPNQILLHEQLLTDVWGPNYRNELDNLRSYIHFLRKKLGPDASSSEIIVSIPGVGYMLTAPESGN